jgi:hypothetical protein
MDILKTFKLLDGKVIHTFDYTPYHMVTELKDDEVMIEVRKTITLPSGNIVTERIRNYFKKEFPFDVYVKEGNMLIMEYCFFHEKNIITFMDDMVRNIYVKK